MKENKVLRKLFLGFIQTHILLHAEKEPIYGQWLIEELRSHGYEISPGTLYPILHNLKDQGLLEVGMETVEGKQRKYYSITHKGSMVLKNAKTKVLELARELMEDD
ncbi:PadR family transcriptional regulator [Desulfitibacter alkalitolerans]|uniref:PadR family transcriptional regulator n=1 Tax=Desulfitibacter alkalitolerans TaxID=264641 RepID=UPI0005520DA1|nr:PadR family transcriptional regulator [Desulfitibacter alkalitolerans]